MFTPAPAGQYRHSIYIQRRFEETRDTFAGAEPPAWVDVCNPKAGIVTRFDGERLVGSLDQIQASNLVIFRIRWRRSPAITPEMRVQFQNRTMFVKNVINVNEANRELVLYCDEVVNVRQDSDHWTGPVREETA